MAEATGSAMERENVDATPVRSARLRRLVWLCMVLALTAVITSVAALRDDSAAPSAVPASDVPRVEKGKIVYSRAFEERVELSDVEVRTVSLTPVVAAVGTVTFDPRHVARVGTRLRGVVRAVQAFEGSHVKRGQTLALINSPELADAQAQVSMLRAQLAAAQNYSTRQQTLATHSLTTAREAERASVQEESYESMLRAAEQKVAVLAGMGRRKGALGEHTLIAPLDGTIVERHVTQGELVSGNEVAFLIAQLDHLWIELDVFERNLPAIQPGDAVTIQPLSMPELHIHGRVAQVGPVLDERTRSAPVRIEVDNTEHRLRPGQAVDARISASRATQPGATVLPAEAITLIDGKATVFVRSGPGSVVPTVVELGKSDGKQRQVLSGLSPGQRVITHGVFALKSELFR